MTEDRAISLKAVLEICECSEVDFWSGEMHRKIEELPSVTSQQKIGHWIKIKPYPLQMHDYECSECGHETGDNTENYCSECGCHMIEPQESEYKE